MSFIFAIVMSACAVSCSDTAPEPVDGSGGAGGQSHVGCDDGLPCTADIDCGSDEPFHSPACQGVDGCVNVPLTSASGVSNDCFPRFDRVASGRCEMGVCVANEGEQ